MLVAAPAAAQEVPYTVKLLHGHPIHHEPEHEAGVAMASSITPGDADGADLVGLCGELQATAGLGDEHRDGLRLETLFVVPYKGMAVEGYYWPPEDAGAEEGVLVRGSDIARHTLDDIVARAGLPSTLLDETGVEQEISCSLDEPLWSIAWYDVRPVGDEQPDAVIEQAYHRFLAVHQSVLEHGRQQQIQTAQRAARRG